MTFVSPKESLVHNSLQIWRIDKADHHLLDFVSCVHFLTTFINIQPLLMLQVKSLLFKILCCRDTAYNFPSLIIHIVHVTTIYWATTIHIHTYITCTCIIYAYYLCIYVYMYAYITYVTFNSHQNPMSELLLLVFYRKRN